jgi:hypothetical protein
VLRGRKAVPGDSIDGDWLGKLASVCCRNFRASSFAAETRAAGRFNSSITRITSTEGSGLAVTPSNARQETIFAGWPLSFNVKSCWRRPVTGLPFLSVTVTSSLIILWVGSGSMFAGSQGKG